MGMMWKFDAGQELKRSLVYLNGSFESFAHRCGIEPERLCRILNYEECATENEIENIAEQSGFFTKYQLAGLLEAKETEYWGDTFGHPIPPEPSKPEIPYSCVVHVNNSPHSTILSQSPGASITQTNNYNTLASMDNAQLSKELESIRHAVANLPDKNDIERLVEEIQEAARTNTQPSKLEKLNKLLDALSKIATVAEAAGKWLG